MNNHAGRLLTVAEVADRLSVSKGTLLTWVAQRRIPSIKLGEARNAPVRFRELDVEAFLDENTRGPEPPRRRAFRVVR